MRIAAILAAIEMFFSLLCPNPAPAAAGDTIIYPPDMALLSGSASLNLLGFLPRGSSGTVTVSGAGGTRTQVVATGAFTAKIVLDPGENVLTLNDKKVTVYFSRAGSTAPPAYAPADTHAVDNDCTECHVFSGGTAKLIEQPPKLCVRCHDDMLKGKDGKPWPAPHPPAQEGDCLACHGFHRLAITREPAELRRERCFGCHDDFTDGGKMKMHAPVGRGECTGCHGPHGAPEKKLLLAAGLELCLRCHTDPGQAPGGKPWVMPHLALEEGCSSCHKPHVADRPRLLVKPEAELCADCHEPFLAEAGGKTLVRHNPVEEGECGSCHMVHGSDAKKFLVADGKALCLSCHDDPSVSPDGNPWDTEHPALDDGCIGCHLPHVAPAAGLLRKPTPALCFECHDPFAAPAAGTGGSLHRPVIKGECAGCHAPHGSAAKKLLLASPERELCLKCHKDPALDPAGAPWVVPHPALDDGCPSCHVPHVANSPRLLAKPAVELCAGCHEDMNLNSDGDRWASPHAPVVKGLCGSCHNPHGSREGRLLKQPQFEICLVCHKEVHENHRRAELDPVTRQNESGSATLPEGFPRRKSDGMLSCVGCHQPHGSDAQYMWTRDGESFCFFCHTKI